MVIFDQYKFCFQHIPKTGGTFVRLFFHHHMKPSNSFDEHPRYSNLKNNQDYDLLVCVRNPLDRIVSLYCDLCHWNGITNFDLDSGEETAFYVPEWIEDRKRIKSKRCNNNSIEFFLNNSNGRDIFFGDILEKNIKLCKELGKKVFVLRQECLANDLIMFLDSKKIEVSNEALSWLFNNNIRRSNTEVFNKAKIQLMKNKRLLKMILDKESFLADMYSIVF